jgi:hypothetical protein
MVLMGGDPLPHALLHHTLLSIYSQCSMPAACSDRVLPAFCILQNMSKFVAEDVPLFLSLIDDLFPGLKAERSQFPDVMKALEKVQNGAAGGSSLPGTLELSLHKLFVVSQAALPALLKSDSLSLALIGEPSPDLLLTTCPPILKPCPIFRLYR